MRNTNVDVNPAAFEGGLQKDVTFTKTYHEPSVCFNENGN